jgi:hypothetical protein
MITEFIQVPQLWNNCRDLEYYEVDDISYFDEAQSEWFIWWYYYYLTWLYIWGGCAVLQHKTGKRSEFDLWHCSCYWPLEYVSEDRWFYETLEDVLNSSKFNELQIERILSENKSD